MGEVKSYIVTDGMHFYDIFSFCGDEAWRLCHLLQHEPLYQASDFCSRRILKRRHPLNVVFGNEPFVLVSFSCAENIRRWFNLAVCHSCGAVFIFY